MRNFLSLLKKHNSTCHSFQELANKFIARIEEITPKESSFVGLSWIFKQDSKRKVIHMDLQKIKRSFREINYNSIFSKVTQYNKTLYFEKSNPIFPLIKDKTIAEEIKRTSTPFANLIISLKAFTENS